MNVYVILLLEDLMAFQSLIGIKQRKINIFMNKF